MTKNIEVDLWRTTSVSSSTVDKAEDEIEDLADQLDTSAKIYRKGMHPGSDDHDTYQGYLDEFRYLEAHNEGRRSLLIYERSFKKPNGEDGFDKYPNLGASMYPYRHDQRGYTIVNGNILETSVDNLADLLDLGADAIGDWFFDEEKEKIFENTVKHELLHSMMEQTNSPNGGSDHAYGKVDVPVAWWKRNKISPMLTGYVAGGFNDTPSPCCDGCSHGGTDWMGTLSECTKSEATRWLQEEYYSDDDGSDPCQPWDPLCPSQ